MNVLPFHQAVPASGKASNCIEPFNVQPGNKVLLLLRVSGREQGRRNNIISQSRKLDQAVREAGGIVVGEYAHVGPGHGTGWLICLADALDMARKKGASIILAATTDRILRSKHFISNKKGLCDAQPDDSELKELDFITKSGVRLMTFLHPDASPKECRSLRTRWSQDIRGDKGGRPRKDERGRLPKGETERRKELLMPIILRLHRDHPSWGSRKIARFINDQNLKRGDDQKQQLKISYRTVQTWLKEAGNLF